MAHDQLHSTLPAGAFQAPAGWRRGIDAKAPEPGIVACTAVAAASHPASPAAKPACGAGLAHVPFDRLSLRRLGASLERARSRTSPPAQHQRSHAH